jgi:hypothetical protein
VPLTAGTQATQFFLPSAGPEAVTAPFVVPDRCSDWHGFAGGGAGAFLP